MASRTAASPTPDVGGTGRREDGTDADLTIAIPALNEADNLTHLLPRLKAVLAGLECRYEIIIVDGGSRDSTASVATSHGARLVQQTKRGYGDAIREAIKWAEGEYVLTLDADLSHDPSFIPSMWAHRDSAALVIASRYVDGGSARMPRVRYLLSRILNLAFSRLLSLPFRDLSSGFRLYKTAVVRGLELASDDFDVNQEILVKVVAGGWPVVEVPFSYEPRENGSSKARLLKFARSYLSTLGRMWRFRNSIQAADYDERAARSWLLPQRLWQQARYRIITELARGSGRKLDVGCGSSAILRDTADCVGLDLARRKLRYMSRYGKPMVEGTIFALPFQDASFDVLICSEVIEHIPEGLGPFHELRRVLKPGGFLILGTPDYGRDLWRVIEWAYERLVPGGYAVEHITHYSRETLSNLVRSLGFHIESVSYVFGCELILSLRKE